MLGEVERRRRKRKKKKVSAHNVGFRHEVYLVCLKALPMGGLSGGTGNLKKLIVQP